MPLQPKRQQQLLHLPLGRSGVRQEQRLRDLLGERGTALNDPSGGHIDPGSPQQPDRVDAKVVIKSPVLHRHHGGGQVAGKLCQMQRFPDQIAERGDDMAGSVLQGQAGSANGVQRRFGEWKVTAEPQHHHRRDQGQPDRGDEAPAQQPENARASTTAWAFS